MDIKPFISQVASIIIQGYEKGKIGVLWCGHQIQNSYLNHLIPGTKKLSALAVTSFDLIQKTSQTQPRIIFAIVGGLLIAGITIIKLANCIENRIFRSALKIIGVAALIGVTGAAGIGLFTMAMV